MTTTVKIHVNGRYRATVKRNNDAPIVVEGNYEGSPNPSGEAQLHFGHGGANTFVITEEYVEENKSSAT